MAKSTTLAGHPKADSEYIEAIERDLQEIQRLADEWEYRQQRIEDRQARIKIKLDELARLRMAG